MEVPFDDAIFTELPSLIMWLDTSSYVGTDYFVNKADTSETIRFYGAPTINQNENSLVFSGATYGTYSTGTKLNNEYTILVLASYFGPKTENDIIGTNGLITGDFLLMNFGGYTRGHQWGPSSTLYRVDSTETPPRLFLGQMFSPSGVLSLVENGIVTRATNGIGVSVAGKMVVIASRTQFYGVGRLDARIKAIKMYNKALTDQELSYEYQRMIARYN